MLSCQGVCVVPQNFPSHFSMISHHKTFEAQDPVRVWSAQDISSCTNDPKLGFEFA